MKRILIVWIVMVGVLAVSAVRAEETNRFKTSVSIGYTMTDGNSKTMQANGSIVTEGEKEGLGSVRAGIEANYGESTVNSQREATVNNADAFANVKKTISPRTFGYLAGSVLHDDIAAVDYRVTVGPGLGVYLVKNKDTSLSVEAGPSYIWQEVAKVRDNYFALRFAERFDQKLSATAKIWESAEYLPKADDLGDYLLNGELGVEAVMTTRVNLKLVLQDKYNSTPADDLKSNDLTLIAGISIKL
jgi:putative salt-induced outer membrane protein YdiY